MGCLRAVLCVFRDAPGGGTQPRWGWVLSRWGPRVARGAQPWAGGGIPLGFMDAGAVAMTDGGIPLGLGACMPGTQGSAGRATLG